MDASALEVLVIPACYGVLLGLLGGLVIGRLIEFLDSLIARLDSASRAQTSARTAEPPPRRPVTPDVPGRPNGTPKRARTWSPG